MKRYVCEGCLGKGSEFALNDQGVFATVPCGLCAAKGYPAFVLMNEETNTVIVEAATMPVETAVVPKPEQ